MDLLMKSRSSLTKHVLNVCLLALYINWRGILCTSHGAPRCWFCDTYGTCRVPLPPVQPAPARWDRSCSICPWVYLHHHWNLRPVVVVALVELGGQGVLQAAPYSNRTATTFLIELLIEDNFPVLWSNGKRTVTPLFLHTRFAEQSAHAHRDGRTTSTVISYQRTRILPIGCFSRSLLQRSFLKPRPEYVRRQPRVKDGVL